MGGCMLGDGVLHFRGSCFGCWIGAGSALALTGHHHLVCSACAQVPTCGWAGLGSVGCASTCNTWVKVGTWSIKRAV